MKRGFYTIMAAQFFSSLADNALFVAAVELLKSSGLPLRCTTGFEQFYGGYEQRVISQRAEKLGRHDGVKTALH